MLERENVIYKEVKEFIQKTAGYDLTIYNTALLTTPPTIPNRIEFNVDNFISKGHNYKENYETQDDLFLGLRALYDCTIEIRVIDIPETARSRMTKIVNGLNHSDFRNIYLNSLSIRPHTMYQHSYPVKQDGTIYNIERMVVKASFMLTDKFSIDWFNKIIDTKLILDGKEEVI